MVFDVGFYTFFFVLQSNRLHEVGSVLLHGLTDKTTQLFCDFIKVEDGIFYFFEVTLKTVEMSCDVIWFPLVVWFRVSRRVVNDL